MKDTFVAAAVARPGKELCAPTQLLFQVLSWGCQLTAWHEVWQGGADKGRKGESRDELYWELSRCVMASILCSHHL